MTCWWHYLAITFLCVGTPASGQTTDSRQKKLEKQRQQLQQEIKQINKLLYTNVKRKKTALTEVEDLDVKLNVRKQLIKVNNEQANLLSRRIGINQRDISRQRKELKELKDDYAKMVVKSYQSKSSQSRLMFLFSSENFLQAYKRIQYLKQYSSFRKKQGEAIAEKTLLLQELNKSLIKQKRIKELLVAENKAIQVKLEGERKKQKEMIRTLKKKEKNLAFQINKKEKKAREIDREIERLIREAIVESNKKAGKASNKTFVLTPEAKLISKNFQANKGRLPWPIEKGIVIQRFGMQSHPVVKTTMIKSSGLTIATEPNAQARTVFNGEVMSVLTYKGSNPIVLIQHGNYITAYKNLGKVYVKKGDKVRTKQPIGEVFTNKKTGKATLQFSVFNKNTPQNPDVWITSRL